VIVVVNVEGARRALRGGLLRCSDCDGVLRAWASTRTRWLHGPGGQRVEVTPDRARCRDCRRTHVMLPAFVVPRRAYTAEVIGAALPAGTGPDAAPAVDVPAATACRRRRAVRRGSGSLVAQACRVAGVFDADVFPADGQGRPAIGELAAALDALGAAARAFVAGMAAPIRSAGGPLTGIDYPALLEATHRRALAGQVRIADPDAVGSLTPWPAVTLITGGRLLTTPPGQLIY
jgi:Domain of unknown function (DUF6431)